jgi:hypothetical protein
MGKETILIVVILGIGALVAYKFMGLGPVQVRSIPSGSGVNAVKAAPAPKPATSRAAGQKLAEHKAAVAGSSPAAAVPVFPPAVMMVTIPPDLPFPTPQALKVGSSRAEIRATYGDPAMNIAGIRNGHVLERYYYLNRERSLLTVATVENGTLTAAESLSSPYFQTPQTKLP